MAIFNEKSKYFTYYNCVVYSEPRTFWAARDRKTGFFTTQDEFIITISKDAKIESRIFKLPAILEPYFHLTLCHLQSSSQEDPIVCAQVLLQGASRLAEL